MQSTASLLDTGIADASEAGNWIPDGCPWDDDVARSCPYSSYTGCHEFLVTICKMRVCKRLKLRRGDMGGGGQSKSGHSPRTFHVLCPFHVLCHFIGKRLRDHFYSEILERISIKIQYSCYFSIVYFNWWGGGGGNRFFFKTIFVCLRGPTTLSFQITLFCIFVSFCYRNSNYA